MKTLTRRMLLKSGLLAAASPLLIGEAWSRLRRAPELGKPDRNGISLPRGFHSRVIARSGEIVIPGLEYEWHSAPDGGACIPTRRGGWIYVSNSEMPDGDGGVSAIRFDRDGAIMSAYPILKGTTRNCAGGRTPWNTWLSCEEFDQGRVWECDPTGRQKAVVRPALGVCNHEAVAVDRFERILYLTEDKPDGGLYRFIPEDYPDLSAGRLQVAVHGGRSRDGQRLVWRDIEDPSAEKTPLRRQVPEMVRFDGGEGIEWHQGMLYFTTKGDDSVWQLDTRTQVLDLLYEASSHLDPLLTGVDNLTVDRRGNLYVAEDGGDMQVVVVGRDGALFPIAQIPGHSRSEIAGVAFSPDGTRLYFSSQRGESGRPDGGITYEISGPF